MSDVYQDAAYRLGQMQEQKRIIKLLEESESACAEWAIALIKGENK